MTAELPATVGGDHPPRRAGVDDACSAGATRTPTSPASSTCSRSTSTRARSRPTGATCISPPGRGASASWAGPLPASARTAGFWSSRVHPEDREAYERFNERLVSGQDAEVTYRLLGVDGVTRVLWDRARPRALAPTARRASTGSSRTSRRARRPRRAGRGERPVHAPAGRRRRARVPRARPSRRAPRGAVPGPRRRPAARRCDPRPGDGQLGGGAPPGRPPGLRRVQRRARRGPRCRRGVPPARRRRRHPLGARPRGGPPHPDGTLEVSGIVSDVTERRRMRAELGAGPRDACRRSSTRWTRTSTRSRRPRREPPRPSTAGPNREVLTGGPLPATTRTTAFERLVHPDDRARRRAALAGSPAAQPVEVEYRVRGLDGHERIVSEQLRPRRDADGSLLFDGVGRDITERRRWRRAAPQHGRDAAASLELERAAPRPSCARARTS